MAVDCDKRAGLWDAVICGGHCVGDQGKEVSIKVIVRVGSLKTVSY